MWTCKVECWIYEEGEWGGVERGGKEKREEKMGKGKGGGKGEMVRLCVVKTKRVVYVASGSKEK